MTMELNTMKNISD